MKTRIVWDGEYYFLQKRVFFFWLFLPSLRHYIDFKEIKYYGEYRYMVTDYEEAREEVMKYIRHYRKSSKNMAVVEFYK